MEVNQHKEGRYVIDQKMVPALLHRRSKLRREKETGDNGQFQ